ncbi:MAG: hypothetical protein M1820_008160 [Bogoriella megaspora]|nr:MAG: hypothetical protein M1820_008160 [Bogoriella megaspora]
MATVNVNPPKQNIRQIPQRPRAVPHANTHARNGDVVDTDKSSPNDRAESHGKRGGGTQQWQSKSVSPKFIVAVDFGTTYSTVAYVKVESGTDISDLGPNDIRCIDNYEDATGSRDARMNARYDNVPTELLYYSPSHSDSENSDSDSAYSENGFDQDYESPKDSPQTRPRFRGRKRNRRVRQQTWKPQGRTEWGYGVHVLQKHPHGIRSKKGVEVVRLIKLSLGDEQADEAREQDSETGDASTERLKEVQQELRKQVRRLQDLRAVRSLNDILVDYLVRLLHHAKLILRRNEGLTSDTTIDYVLCVPVSWSPIASQIMHNAMASAVRKSGLGRLLEDTVIADLFIVSEPEAAAQFVLASLGERGRLRQNQIFVLLDAGGGTVDITTYKVTSDGSGPLRLEGEMIPADGALCGSSLINEAYKKRLLEKLSETDFNGGADELNSVVAGLVADFEVSSKPYIDFTKKKTLPRRLFIPGLKDNAEKNISKHYLKFSEQEIRDIFRDCLNGVARLLESQLDLAARKGLTVIDVVVVGGFGESPALRERIEHVVASRANMVGGKIGLIWPDKFPTSTVARGAVLRSLNKENGPSRISRASYGFLRTEQYKNPEYPKSSAAHVEAGVVPSIDKVDGFKYVRNTIYWLFQKGETLDTSHKSETITSSHIFEMKAANLICVECLYASPGNHRSHFQRNHEENTGAIELGSIEIDMTPWRNQLPTCENAFTDSFAKMAKRKNIDVTFDLVMIVEGHQLIYEARWPSSTQKRALGDVRVKVAGYLSLAPGFDPGTA